MTSAPGEDKKVRVRDLVRSAVIAANDTEAAISLAEEAFENWRSEGITVDRVAVELGITYAVAERLQSRELALRALICSAEYRSSSDEDASFAKRQAAFHAAQTGNDIGEQPG